LTLAAATGNESLVRQQLLDNDVPANAKNKGGSSALVEAAKAGHVPIMQFLLTMVTIDINIEDHQGCTPLYWAVANGHLEGAQLLLQRPGLKRGTRVRRRGDFTPDTVVQYEAEKLAQSSQGQEAACWQELAEQIRSLPV